MADDLEALVNISLRLGGNPFWVQGPGGNTSIKTSDGQIIVKASGSELKNVSGENGFSHCSVETANKRMTEILRLGTYPEREAAYAEAVEKANLFPERDKRPSMELGIHTLLPHKFVLHFHSPCALLACHAVTTGTVEQLLENSGFQVVKLGFVLPGYSLAAEFMKITLPKDNASTVVFLRNHGVVLACSAKVEENLQQYREWERIFWNSLNPPLDYEAAAQRKILYDFAATHECDLEPLFPDSIILEQRMREVCTLRAGKYRLLNLDNATRDAGAADLAAVECLLKNLAPDLPAIDRQAQQQIREMPAEIARTKLMQGVAT